MVLICELVNKPYRTMTNEFDFDVPSEFVEKDGGEMLEEFLDECPATEDSYINVFGAYYSVLRLILPTSAKVLMWMAFNSELDKGRVIIQSKSLKRVLSELGISRTAYFNSIRDLKAYDVIRGYDAVFFLNPRYMWRGSDKRRHKFMARYPYIENEKPQVLE